MPRPRIGWTWQPIDRSVLGAYWASKCQLAVNTPAPTWGNNGFIVRGAPPAPPGRGVGNSRCGRRRRWIHSSQNFVISKRVML